MNSDQEIRAAALQAAATLYGHLAGTSLGDAESPDVLSAAGDRTEALAARFERFIGGPEAFHGRGAPAPRR